MIFNFNFFDNIKEENDQNSYFTLDKNILFFTNELEEDSNNDDNLYLEDIKGKESNNNILQNYEIKTKPIKKEENSKEDTKIKTKSTMKTKNTNLIFEITKNKLLIKKLGRKRKNNDNNIQSEYGSPISPAEGGVCSGLSCMPDRHDKYKPDNIVRKIKSKLFESILIILNSSIYDKSKNYLSSNIFLKIEQKIIKDTNVISNQNLLKTKLKNIFSNNVSDKFKNYGLDYNKKLIIKIYKENIQTKTIAILERTLLECLEHFRGSKYYPELEGLENEYTNVITKFKEDGETDDYINCFKEIINIFEEFYNNKKPRKTKN